jgi:hypothetical protein
MIQIKTGESKELYFNLIIEGIEKTKLDFTFRILSDNIEYGIAGTFEKDKVKVIIPPIDSFILNRQNDLLEAKLEVTGDNKYYMKPWNDKIQFIDEPKIAAQIEEEKNEEIIKENIKIQANLDKIESIKNFEEKITKPVKKTKFGALLQEQ